MLHSKFYLQFVSSSPFRYYHISLSFSQCSLSRLYLPYTISNVQSSSTPFTRYSGLSNRLHNRLDNLLHRVNKHPSGSQTGWTIGCIVGWQLVWQEVVSCKRNFTQTRLTVRHQYQVVRIQLIMELFLKTGQGWRFSIRGRAIGVLIPNRLCCATITASDVKVTQISISQR